MFGRVTLVNKDFPLFSPLNFLFQTKEQQEQLLNQSNEVFLYCGFLDYRSESLTHTGCFWWFHPSRMVVSFFISFFSGRNHQICLCSSNEGIWSNEGCVRSEGNMTYSVCLCNHLTNFAILMQVVPLKVGFWTIFSSPKLILKRLPAARCFQLSTVSQCTKKVLNSVDIVSHNAVKAVLTTGWRAQRVHSPSKTNTFVNMLIWFQLLHIIVRFYKLCKTAVPFCVCVCVENCTTAVTALHGGL